MRPYGPVIGHISGLYGSFCYRWQLYVAFDHNLMTIWWLKFDYCYHISFKHQTTLHIGHRQTNILHLKIQMLNANFPKKCKKKNFVSHTLLKNVMGLEEYYHLQDWSQNLCYDLMVWYWSASFLFFSLHWDKN